MKRERQYACHRVYQSPGEFDGRSVVCIGMEGEVKEHYPLTDEIPSTEWIGGVIVLSGRTELPATDNDSRWMHLMNEECQPPLYAWHISEFDFAKERPAPGSIIRRL